MVGDNPGSGGDGAFILPNDQTIGVGDNPNPTVPADSQVPETDAGKTVANPEKMQTIEAKKAEIRQVYSQIVEMSGAKAMEAGIATTRSELSAMTDSTEVNARIGQAQEFLQEEGRKLPDPLMGDVAGMVLISGLYFEVGLYEEAWNALCDDQSFIESMLAMSDTENGYEIADEIVSLQDKIQELHLLIFRN